MREEATRRHNIGFCCKNAKKVQTRTKEMKTIRKLLPTHKRAMTMWRICAYPIICHSIILGLLCIQSKSLPYHWPISSKRFCQPPLILLSSHSTLHTLFIRNIAFYDILFHVDALSTFCAYRSQCSQAIFIIMKKKKILIHIFTRTRTHKQFRKVGQELDYISIYLLH